MVKRKSQPQKADEAKRQLMTWNMTDQFQPLIDDSEEIEEHDKGPGICSNNESSSEPRIGDRDELLDNLIGFSDFYIPVYKKARAKQHGDWRCELGSLQLYLSGFTGRTSPKQTLPHSDIFYIYVNKDTEELLIYYEVIGGNENSTSIVSKRVTYFKAVAQGLTSAIFEALKVKPFCLVLDTYSYQTCCMNIKVYMDSNGLVNLKFAAEYCGMGRRFHTALGRLVAHWYGIQNTDYTGRRYRHKHCIESVLSAVRRLHENDPAPPHVNIQHPSLRPSLRAYQKRAVAWMLYKERYGQQDDEPEERLHPLYTEIKSRDGQTLFYNKYSCYLTTERPLYKQSPPGGILADEMGLGKTVEVLALILLHPRSDVRRPSPLPVIKAEEEVKPQKGKARRRIRKSKSEPVINRSKNPRSALDMVKHRTSNPGQAPDSSSSNDGKISEPSTSNAEVNVPEASETCGSNSFESARSSNSALNVSARPETEVSRNVETMDASSDHIYAKQSTSGKQQSNYQENNTHPGSENSQVTSSTNIVSNQKANDSNEKDMGILNSMEKDVEIPGEDSQLNAKNEAVQESTAAAETENGDFGVEKTKDVTVEKKNPNGGESLDESAEIEKGSSWNVTPRKQTFECICGEYEDLASCQTKAGIVQCEKCTLWQHARCVNYQLSDPYRGRFLCPHCHVTNEPLPSGATLIITPESISFQWVDEILKHILSDSLSVFVYTGVHKQGFIQPQLLANQDLVITTYETLRKEIDYVDLPHSNCMGGRKLRNPKRYMAVPSPIVAVEWWRICLDEAQMVEGTTTKTAEMALRLSAINRWCVTGTPIQRGLKDAYGLLLFLGLDPYWVHPWWNKLLLEPFCYGDEEPLLRVLADVLWRSAKKDVLEEINLPNQAEQVHWLKFAPVEQHFYTSQYRKCEQDANQKLKDYKDGSLKLNSLDRYSLSKLLLPLTKLRQACCHPQAVRGEFLPIQKSAMTMEEVLQQLIKKTTVECEEAHRQYVAAKNGLAGICVIRKDYAAAVDLYREVLRSVAEHEGNLRTDPLQQLHTLHNLNDVLQLKPAGVSPTLRDSELSSQADEIRTKYRKKAELLVTGALESWLPVQKNVRELQSKLQPGQMWWAEVIQYNLELSRGENLVTAVKQALSDNSTPDYNSMIRKFVDGRGLMLALHQALDALQSLHENLTASIHKLRDAPADPALVAQAVECCIRPVGAPLATCVFCKAHKLFEEYEGKLYCFVDKGVAGAAETEDVEAIGGAMTFFSGRKGTWADSETDKCLKALLAFSKTWGCDRRLIEFGQVHLKLFEALKKEFKCLRSMWMLLKEQAQSVDECDMAVMRLRVRMPTEQPRDLLRTELIEPGAVDIKRAGLETDKVMAKNELKKKLGHLKYLKNLTETPACLETGRNPDACPICQYELGTGWAVLRCGHSYCLKCIEVMVLKYSFGPVNVRSSQQMKCPSCRQKTRHADIAYVSTKKSREETAKEDIIVKGDHSTKIQGVVKCLMQIQRDDPEAKSLIFSTWQDVLGVLCQALNDNKIPYRSLTSYKFQENLESFKRETDVKVLLLPVHSGANGLNLIEATHVLLVEPILNPASELQAIGRVHRIGQTRPTFVHRFIVRNTIEERMNGLLQTAEASSDSHNPDETSFTIDDLKALFIQEEHVVSDDDGDDDNAMTSPSPNAQPVVEVTHNAAVASSSAAADNESDELPPDAEPQPGTSY